MPHLASEAGRRIELNRLYAQYAKDPNFAHMLEHTSGVVPGDGPTRPRLVFLGEAPGRNEDRAHKPFIGASGQFLNELLESVGIDRSEVFITNAVKIRPVAVVEQVNRVRVSVQNRPPTEAEKLASIPYLRLELRLLGNPPIVVLGKHARSVAQKLPTKFSLHDGEMAIGKWAVFDGRPMLPLHHPAYGIYQRANRPMMFRHFKAVLTPPERA